MKKALVNITMAATIVLFAYGIYSFIGLDNWAKYVVLVFSVFVAWFWQGLVNAIQGEKVQHTKENNAFETKWALIGAMGTAGVCALLPVGWGYLIAVGIGIVLTLYFWKHQA